MAARVVREYRVLMLDGRILSIPASLRGETEKLTDHELRTLKAARVDIGKVAVIQAWGDPYQADTRSGEWAGHHGSWQPSAMMAAAAAYRAAGLVLDDPLPPGGGTPTKEDEPEQSEPPQEPRAGKKGESGAVLVESRSEPGAYGFAHREAIIDHPKHGRLYITEGWCGEGEIRGEMYRWDGGQVHRVAPDATLEDCGGLWVSRDLRDSCRTLLDWKGHMIEKLAKSVGL